MNSRLEHLCWLRLQFLSAVLAVLLPDESFASAMKAFQRRRVGVCFGDCADSRTQNHEADGEYRHEEAENNQWPVEVIEPHVPSPEVTRGMNDGLG